MSDVSKNNDLIQKLRELSDRIFNDDGKTRDFRLIDRAADALEAAANSKPQAPYSDPVMTAPQAESDIEIHEQARRVIEGAMREAWCDADEYEHLPEIAATRVVERFNLAAPVLPSSTVDEGRISEAIEDAIIDNLHPENTTNGFYVPFTRVVDIARVAARAVAEAIGGEGL